MGSISRTYLCKSQDLIGRLKTLNFNDKKRVTFEVISLFTNVEVEGALTVVKDVL